MVTRLDLSTRLIRLAANVAGILFLFTQIPAHPSDLATLYEEARQAQAAGDEKTAIEKYKQIVRLRPDLTEAHSNLGLLYYQQHQVDDARKSFRTALKLKPNLAAPNFFLGLIAFNARQYEVAERHLTKSEALDPANSSIQLYLGYVYYAQSNFPAAARHLEKAGKLDPTDQDALCHWKPVLEEQHARGGFARAGKRAEDQPESSKCVV